MIKITDEMRERIDNAWKARKFSLLATSSKKGEPNISFRASIMVWDDEHLFFWDRSRQLSAEHMEENPNVVVLYADLPDRIGWRFYGEATVFKDGEMRRKIMERTIQAELDKDPERKGYGVLIRVDKIRRYSGDEVIQER